MASVKNSIAVVDDRPYFEKAVRYGLEQGILTPENITRMEADGPKGIVQIADHFGTAYLRTDLESAVARMANLISLYLEDFSNGDLRAAAISLRDNTLLSHSRGGSEMLKRLHAMPGDTSLHLRKVEPAAQKIFVNERSFAFPLSVASYRAQVEQCQANQMRIDFARWLARQLGAQQDEYEDYSAEEVIRSAMLLLYVGAKTLELPSKSEFIKLVEALRKKSFKHKPATLDAFLREAPEAFQQMTRQAMESFIETALPRLKSPEKSADEILHGEAQGAFFVRDMPDGRFLGRRQDRGEPGAGQEPGRRLPSAARRADRSRRAGHPLPQRGDRPSAQGIGPAQGRQEHHCHLPRPGFRPQGGACFHRRARPLRATRRPEGHVVEGFEAGCRNPSGRQ